MRLSKNEKICGIGAKELRDFMRGHEQVTVDDVVEGLCLSSEESAICLKKLAEAGYVEREVSSRGREYFKRTTSGNALAKAKFLAPIRRAKAEALLHSVVKRAEEINNSPDFIHTVDRIYVFGSYLSDACELGDVDLIVEDSFKSELGDKIEVTQEHAATSGRHFLELIEALYYPREQVEIKLRNRSPYLDIQEPDQIELLNLKPKLIFERSGAPLLDDQV